MRMRGNNYVVVVHVLGGLRGKDHMHMPFISVQDSAHKKITIVLK